MKKILFVLIVFILALAAGCTPGEVTQVEIPSASLELSVPGLNPALNTTDANGRVAGILLGIWHGFISPVTMVLSFVNPDLQMYEVHNDGSQYNFGFLLGAAIVFVFLGVFGARRR
ncbi:MAG: hypothetical protein KG029_05995 [Bacteroidetes bacterium]|jgi:hypothetical protein|nr:hypothetical protein [Bacteroidota bacterium]